MTKPTDAVLRGMATKQPMGISAADMRSLVDSLDLIEQEGNSFGELVSAEVKVGSTGGDIAAVYADGEWRITVARP